MKKVVGKLKTIRLRWTKTSHFKCHDLPKIRENHAIKLKNFIGHKRNLIKFTLCEVGKGLTSLEKSWSRFSKFSASSHVNDIQIKGIHL